MIQSRRMLNVLPDLIAILLLIAAIVVEGLLAVTMVIDGTVPDAWLWLTIHLSASVVTALSVSWIAQRVRRSVKEDYIPPLNFLPLCSFAFVLVVTVPLVGAIGVSIALFYGLNRSAKRHRQNIYWQTTKNAELPFTTPIGRNIPKYDSRGFNEQLMYEQDEGNLYAKVLAAGNIRTSLSVDALRTAVMHREERIRLTAYQTLDRKVTKLNLEIQKLELATESQEGRDKSNTWLQIASNYWELLTIEKDEPIAREQLLKKAAAAAFKAVEVLPTNRNAHFTLGRVSLLQGNTLLAETVLRKSVKLGMPEETVLPYLAEAAFAKKDFHGVRSLLAAIDDAFKRYPPLRPVTEFWS